MVSIGEILRDRVGMLTAAEKRESRETFLRIVAKTSRNAENLGRLARRYFKGQAALSVLAEYTIELPELREFRRAHRELHNEYMPSYPPTSPVTNSFLTLWELCDLPLGPFGETIASLYSSVWEVLGLPPDWEEVITTLAESRVGIYEHLGRAGSAMKLRELPDGPVFRARASSGYEGCRGDIILTRIVHPGPAEHVLPEMLTTPYVILGGRREDWTQLLARYHVHSVQEDSEAVRRFFKEGPQPIDTRRPRPFWIEFVLQGYAGFTEECVYLTGIPDIPETLPNSAAFIPLERAV